MKKLSSTPSGRSRRRFIRQLGLGVASLGLLPLYSRAKRSNHLLKLPRIGLQLWTVRNEMEQDLRGTLQRVAETGFAGVETAFFPKGVTYAEAGRILRELELPVLAAHAELPSKGRHKKQMLEMAEAFDCTRMVWHGWPEDKKYHTEDGTRRLAERYNKAHAFAKANGLQLGIHNHWWEFADYGNGTVPFDILLEELEPEIFFEVDTYWALVAGYDPAVAVGKLGPRAPLLHIKDGPAIQDEPMLPAGQGVQDFFAIERAAQGYTEWMIVEFDEYEGDIFSAMQASYDFLAANELAAGKR